MTNTSVKHLSSPTTHSYAASSARLVLLMVSVLIFPFASMIYLETRQTEHSFTKPLACLGANVFKKKNHTEKKTNKTKRKLSGDVILKDWIFVSSIQFSPESQIFLTFRLRDKR